MSVDPSIIAEADRQILAAAFTEALAETNGRLRDGGSELGEADQESAGDG
jgi:hypothetical protein